MSLTITTGIGEKPNRVALKCGSVIEIKVVEQGLGLSVVRIEDLTMGCGHKRLDITRENGITTSVHCMRCGREFK